ncbi:MAG: PKD domain-containing protein [Chitinophagales bacterium]
MKKTLLSLILWTSSFVLWANTATDANIHAHHSHESKIAFIENQGQWHENVLYKASIGGLNTIFLEKKALTYVYFDAEDMAKMHDYSQATPAEKAAFCMKAHAYKVNFLNAQTPKVTEGIDKRTEYHNYFLGKNSEKWARKVGLYDGVYSQGLYKGVHLSTYTANNKLKYDLIVDANADVSKIAMQYDGTDRMAIQNGRLVSYLSVETIIEQAPYAYQVVDGKVKQVACNYVLDEKTKTVSFEFPNGYDTNLQLVIDPEIVAATLSGTGGFSSNYGHCAAFDSEGNILTGAISFDSDYPTNTGAFQTSYGGGQTDIAISKLNPTGTSLTYATFLGGNGSDYPHSLFADLNLNLHVYGSSESNNYPTSSNAYDSTYGGGTSDIVVTVLTPDGSDIVGSTYMGGSDVDGRNTASTNYGDQYRGEIIADFFGNTYIASCTSSSNFPTVNAIQPTSIAGQDGVLFKLNEDLSELEWSTYLGSSGSDMCYGLRIDADYNVYVCGAAGSDDFPSVAGGYQETHNNSLDAYILYISDDGSTILNSTFWGTSSNDLAFFIDIDNEDDVAIYGQTEGTVPLTPAGVYAQADSKQFIASFKPDLATLKYSTAVGGGGFFGGFGLVPDAFMVDNCGYIYFSGYNAVAELETTDDAILNNGGFYVGVLEQNGMGLFYATYYTGNHVDGGTSRFDDNGIVYQAVCSGGGFQTNADAYAPNQSTSWDIGVFKIDFQVPSVNAVANAPSGSIGCTPLTVDFSNLGSSGTVFLWDFADGNTSNEDEPTHTFEEPGIFNVQLIVTDPTSCNQADTAYIKIITLNNEDPIIHEVNICENEVAALAAPDVDDDVAYLWQDGSTEQEFNTLESGTYWVQTSFENLENCFQVDSFHVTLISAAINLGNDTLICGNIHTLDATLEGATHLWSNGSNDAIIDISEDGEYWVAVALGACITTDTINVSFQEPPVIDLGADANICGDESITLDVTTNGANYEWQDGSSDAIFTATEAGTYTVTVHFADNCLVVDSIVVFGGNPQIDLGDDVVICAGEEYILDATTAMDNLENVSFLWNDGSTEPIRTVNQGGTYSVDVSINGCMATDEIVINNFAAFPPINLGEDQTLCQGETLTLALPELQSGVEIRWQDGSSGTDFLVTEAGTYSVELTTNCETVSDDVFVDYIALPDINNPVLIPTAFTPNNDNVNDMLQPVLTGDISDYSFEVYNRWGNQVFATTDMTQGWDGFVKDAETDIGVYAWWCKAKITDCKGTRDLFLKGNTTLIR